MNSDDRTAFEALDFERLLHHLARHAQTLRGSRAAESASLSNSLVEIRKKYKEVEELLDLEEIGTRPPLSGIHDVTKSVASAAEGTVLEIEDLVELRATILGFHQLDEWFEDHVQFCPTLRESSMSLGLDPNLRKQFEGAFEDNGTLSETRYPRLRELREKLISLEKKIRKTLDDLVTGQSLEHLLQDRYATSRGDRWVLPIRASAKRSGLGIVHDTSRSGETVFIEPKEIVELNNLSKLAEGELAREVQRILAELSRSAGRDSSAIFAALDAAERVDLTLARLLLGKEIGGMIPEVGVQGVIKLEAARHPLLALSESTAVPNDLFLDSQHPALVISGPNAGGKTVAMKTLGLCALMTRCAIPLPAKPGSRVDLFQSIATVLGDAQGIESGLSTFSAHILAIRDVLESDATHSLVLLDELASGTDPIQGAALARAILEQLVDRGARVVATTHFSELKSLGTSDSRFRSAAMQFENDAPTYRIEVGREGRSHAFAIARRFGLPETLLTRATEIIGKTEADRIEELDKMDEQRGRLATTSLELESLGEKLEQRSARLDARQTRLEERGSQQVDESAQAAVDQIRAIEAEVVELIGRLQADPSLKSAGSTLQAIRKAKKQVTPQAPPSTPLVEQGTLSIGDRVRHRVLGSKAEITNFSKDGRVEIRTGSLQIWANLEDLEPTLSVPGSTPASSGFQTEPLSGAEGVRTVSNTLDLRGMRVDEAIESVDRFLDRKLLDGDKSVFLLHGHGTGALKSALRKWLGNTWSWRPLDASEGGDAFTLVML